MQQMSMGKETVKMDTEKKAESKSAKELEGGKEPLKEVPKTGRPKDDKKAVPETKGIQGKENERPEDDAPDYVESDDERD